MYLLPHPLFFDHNFCVCILHPFWEDASVSFYLNIRIRSQFYASLLGNLLFLHSSGFLLPMHDTLNIKKKAVLHNLMIIELILLIRTVAHELLDFNFLCQPIWKLECFCILQDLCVCVLGGCSSSVGRPRNLS